MVLIGLLQMHFFDNIKTQKFPSHVIIVRKEDLLTVKEITCFNLKEVNLSASKTTDLSNLETLGKIIIFLFSNNCYLIDFISFKELNGIYQTPEIKIEEFSSLKSLSLSFQSLNQVILTNLIQLRRLELNLETTINSEVLLKLIENLPYIELLKLFCKLSYFNLDNLFNLKELELKGVIKDGFNVHLFDKLCNQLENITFRC